MSSETVPLPSKSARHSLVAIARRWLKRIIRHSWIREVRPFRQLSRSEQALCLKLRLANDLRLRSRERLLIPRRARTIVFVCFGNIMRSPMCEHLFRRAIAQLNPTAGRAAHPWAIKAAKEFGISLANQQATCLTQSMVNSADAILAMDYYNMVQLHLRYPSAKQGCSWLGAYLNRPPRDIEIRDPVFGNEQQTLNCCRLLQDCTQNLAADVRAGHFSQNAVSPAEVEVP